MTSVLIEKTCTPCRGGVPPLTVEEAEAYRVQAPEWVLRDEATRIERTYGFKSFGDAFAFVRGAGELSTVRHRCSNARASRWTARRSAPGWDARAGG
jgi:hypothetical protein